MNKEEEQVISLTIKPAHEKFYSIESNYGIYVASVSLESENLDVVKMDSFSRELNLVGNMPKLKMESTYEVEAIEIKHPKFGVQYQVKSIFERLLSTRAEQLIFLQTLLTEKQVATIVSSYPDANLVDIIKNDEMDLKIVNGIGEKTFEKIKNKIEENEKYQKALIQLTGKFGIPYNAVIRMSDSYGSPDLLLEKINSNPYILTELSGFGFKRVDEIALSLGIELTSEERIKSCIEYLLQEQSDNHGHIWVKQSKIISEATKLLGIRMANVQHTLEEVVNQEDNEIHRIDKSIFHMNNFNYELGISENLKRLLSVNPVVSFDFDFEGAVAKVEERQGFQFTEEQKRAIQYGIDYNIIVVNGKAGTGKTAVIKGIIEVLKMHNDSMKDAEVLEYATCALSGKASQRIQESTGLDSFTIHRLLGFNPRTGWLYNESNKLGQDIIVLDEASMVNSQLFFFLIRAIKNGAKLIITGDTAQLEPIGAGNVLVDLLNSGKIPSVELTIVHRQAQKSGILSQANLVREGIKFLKDNDFKSSRMGELKDLYCYPKKDKKKVLPAVIQIAEKYDGDIMDFQVLTPMKSKGDLSTLNINNLLQKIFNNDPKDVDPSKKVVRKNNTLLEGDKVIINGNNYDKNVFNGTMGIIEYIDDKVNGGEIVIDFEGVGRVSFKMDELKQIDLGYAITIHKSQGSQWKYVVMAFDYSSYVLLNRQLLYTGMTRAGLGLFLIFELKALQFAIETDKSSERNTFVCEMINDDEKFNIFIDKQNKKVS